jgi:hypothetical protein
MTPMRLPRPFVAWLLCLVVASAVRAEPSLDPLRLIPDQADLLVKVERPRRLVEYVLNNELLRDFQNLEAVKEFYDSTNARRAYQLLAYFEKELGVSRMEMLDRLAGGGAAFSLKFAANPTPVMLVIQAKDEPLLRRFFQIALDLVEKELARQEAKDRPEKKIHRGVEVVRIGKQFQVAVVGSALVFSNVDAAMQAAIDLHLDGGTKNLAHVPSVAEARKLAHPDPLVWLWANLETAHKAPGAKEAFELPRNNFQLTVLFGGLLDVARRAPFVCAGLYPQTQGFLASIRMPRGREGMPEALATHLPSPGEPGSLPLLEPKGVLYSSSYFLDISKFWDHRAKLFNEKTVKNLEEFDKNSGKYLASFQFHKFLTLAGPHQRIVVAHQPRPGYTTMPGQNIPAFALVLETRDPEEFTKRAEAALRTGALLASTQVSLKASDEPYKDRKIIVYRFPENGTFAADTDNLRFNFTPCSVTVGNQFVLCSTLELCRELVDLLEMEEADANPKGSSATVQTRFYASGGVELLKFYKDRLLTQTILDQAIPPEKAKEQVQAFTDWVRRLGVLRLESRYGAKDFRYDIQLRLAK